MKINWRRSDVVNQSIVTVIVLVTAYLLKLHYSQAGSGDLIWIIGPVAFFVELFSHLNFIHETGYGWVDFEHDVVIAPACAGVNFLIIAFCMSAFQLAHRVQSLVRVLAKIMMALFLSYAVAIIANVLRILLSTYFYNIEFYSSWLTSEAVHRLVGTCVFFLLLFVYSRTISTFLNRQASRQASEHQSDKEQNLKTRRLIFFVPLVWYLTFSLGVPLANQSFQADPEIFIRHALHVGMVTVVLTLIFIAAHYVIIHFRNVWARLFRSFYIT